MAVYRDCSSFGAEFDNPATITVFRGNNTPYATIQSNNVIMFVLKKRPINFLLIYRKVRNPIMWFISAVAETIPLVILTIPEIPVLPTL